MLRNPQIPAKYLFPFCRSMGRMLEAGVEVRKSLKTSSSNTRDQRLSDTVSDVLTCVKKGDDLTTSFRQHEARCPALFLDLLNVGEQTGSLPEVFAALADYYEASFKRMREFRSQITWPVIQLFAAILVIGAVIYILGIINPGQEADDILGLGLMGTSGAIRWFTMTLGSLFTMWLAYTVATRSAAGQMAVDPFLMLIPGVGGCMRSFAIARFSWCFALTQQAGMPIKPSLESSLKATANGAFIAGIPGIWDQLAGGRTLAEALQSSGLFPVEFLHIVDTAEQTGTVPESLERMSHHFDDDAHRAMTWMTTLLARTIWGMVALFIGFIVIRFFMTYVALINSFNV
ncbi:MAG: type II secretion system F family protein [Fuerstiella sp.]|jgi:type IV pilus assembly protein PilC|nr:type II secretion system F family protein [Fuerstiella sp.]MCP4513071.1 type II secretion system F family protein [Fuerstiella sp.]MDG2126419.1 type II secretion system F family protein [Fuerstiella sp.]